MKAFRAWIAFYDIRSQDRAAAEAAAQVAARRLGDYLRLVIRKVKGTPFSSVSVGLNPTSSSLGPRDLLVTLCTSSFVRAMASTLNVELAGASGKLAGGNTAPFEQGTASEVFWPYVANHGQTSAARGQLIASLAIHEFAHNKCTGDSSVDYTNEVHAKGGGALFSDSLTPGMLSAGNFSPANQAFLAKYLALPVRQFGGGLYSDELGF